MTTLNALVFFSVGAFIGIETVSQAAACEGNYYQIPQQYAEINAPRGVLPI